MAKFVFCGRGDTTDIRGQKIIDVLICNLDALTHLILLYPADAHFITDLFTCVGKRNAFAGHGLLKLGQTHTVLCCDTPHSIIQLRLTDADARTISHLQLHTFGDHAFEYLFTQGACFWQFILVILYAHRLDALFKLAFHDDVVINDGHHTIDQLGFCME